MGTVICKYCLRTFELGVNGTVDGCDECLAVVRNPLDGTIVDDSEFSSLFADDDSLTEMEKA